MNSQVRRDSHMFTVHLRVLPHIRDTFLEEDPVGEARHSMLHVHWDSFVCMCLFVCLSVCLLVHRHLVRSPATHMLTWGSLVC